jgi:hypothetical protein
LKPVIEPLNLPQDKLDQLLKLLADPNQPDMHKSEMIKHTSGACLRCGGIASHIAKHKMSGITRIEKYCDDCLIRMVTNKKTKVKIDR